jgi:hypothetical protein
MASKPEGRIASGTKARRGGVPSARGWPACCPGGARCRGGVSSSQALARNRTTCRPDSGSQRMGMTLSGLREGGPQAARTASGRVPRRGTGRDGS